MPSQGAHISILFSFPIHTHTQKRIRLEKPDDEPLATRTRDANEKDVREGDEKKDVREGDEEEDFPKTQPMARSTPISCGDDASVCETPTTSPSTASAESIEVVSQKEKIRPVCVVKPMPIHRSQSISAPPSPSILATASTSFVFGMQNSDVIPTELPPIALLNDETADDVTEHEYSDLEISAFHHPEGQPFSEYY